MNFDIKTIFEKGSINQGTDIDIDSSAEDFGGYKLGEAAQNRTIGLAGLAEPEFVRHYTQLSQENVCVDSAFYPLGSCTMKHNPRFNEKATSLSGFAESHPFAPDEAVQGCLEVMYRVQELFKNLTGMAAAVLSPAAGAHGELCGIMTIRQALTHKGDARQIILVPTSAHGTNPATAAMCGYKIEQIPVNETGTVDIAYLAERLAGDKGKDVAALMLTNPNTCGLFEKDVQKIADLLHKAGAYFYMDGANFNALMGIAAPADFGVDAMHINIHKTFSAPHGGGGPGSGPVVFAKSLADYVPVPFVKFEGGEYKVVKDAPLSFGRMKMFNGNFPVIVKALAYMLAMGSDGLRQAAQEAVLNANYIKAKLSDTLHLPFEQTCMHEVLFDDKTLTEAGITTLDLAKALQDKGFHPMTVYFPLIVHGAMLIEPTETETKATLDAFIDAIKEIVETAKQGGQEKIHSAPYHTPRRRLDETKAARQPVLTSAI
jgi:glycine dehydrogenase subunit 2